MLDTSCCVILLTKKRLQIHRSILNDSFVTKFCSIFTLITCFFGIEREAKYYAETHTSVCLEMHTYLQLF